METTILVQLVETTDPRSGHLADGHHLGTTAGVQTWYYDVLSLFKAKSADGSYRGLNSENMVLGLLSGITIIANPEDKSKLLRLLYQMVIGAKTCGCLGLTVQVGGLGKFKSLHTA